MLNGKKEWTQNDDHQLSTIVMDYVNNGDTKTAAFKKAAEKLARTEAACRYRWNAVLKEQINQQNDEVTIADVNTHQNNSDQNDNKNVTPPLTMNNVVVFLKDFAQQHQESIHVLKEHEQLQKEHSSLLSEQERLNRKVEFLLQKQSKQKQEYELLLRIVNEAKESIEDEEVMIH